MKVQSPTSWFYQCVYEMSERKKKTCQVARTQVDIFKLLLLSEQQCKTQQFQMIKDRVKKQSVTSDSEFFLDEMTLERTLD